jgi:1-aminocyclopropane-1-carboxylate deaminase
MKKEGQSSQKDWSFSDLNKDLLLPSPVIHLLPNKIFNYHPNIYVKCEYQIHPGFGGNKFRKIYYHVSKTLKKGISSWVTFGGPYSNHIAAVSQIGNKLGIRTTGIIRGRKEFASNATLSRATRSGMKLVFKTKKEFDQYILSDDPSNDYPDSYIIPMGGTDSIGVKGVINLGIEISESATSPDFVVVPFGSGGTFLGLSQNSNFRTIAIPITQISTSFIKKVEADSGYGSKGGLFTNYHSQKIADLTKERLSFILLIWNEFGIPLDPIYNSLSFYALSKMLLSEYFSPDSKIMLVHTGGLQGWLGMRERRSDVDLKFTSLFDKFIE